MKSKNIIITAIIVIIVAAAAFYGYMVYHRKRLQESFGRGAGYGQSDRFDNGEGEIPQSGDLCGGTGGTGQIVSMGDNKITIKRKDGISQIINLTDQTTIRTSTSSVSKSDLKTGDKVTVVVDGSKTASTVLICNVSGPETQSGQ